MTDNHKHTPKSVHAKIKKMYIFGIKYRNSWTYSLKGLIEIAQLIFLLRKLSRVCAIFCDITEVYKHQHNLVLCCLYPRIHQCNADILDRFHNKNINCASVIEISINTSTDKNTRQ